jgi:capsular exopolysaccharide synthesis family protein
MTDSPLARYLVPLQRWWPVIIGALVLGLVGAWLTLPSDPVSADPEAVPIDPNVSYEATHLLARGRPTPATDNLELVALLASQGEIPQVVEAKLGDEVEPGAVASATIEPNTNLGTLGVTAVQPRPEQAERLATAYAEAIIEYFDEQAEGAQQARIDSVTQQLVSIETRIRELQGVLAGLDENSVEYGLAEAELNVATEQYGILQNDLRDLTTGSSEAQSVFVTLQEPVAVSTAMLDEGGFEVPEDSRARFTIAIVLALALGVGAAFALDWVDARIRTREQAEEAFGLPVIADIPRRTKAELSAHPLPVYSEPGSVTAENFRALRLHVLRSPRWRLDQPAPAANLDGAVGTASPVGAEEQPRVLLVSSARDSEGKSTVAANLAASIAEAGKRVLLIDCDFRRPAVGELLGVPAGPGLRELRELDGRHFARAIVPTTVPNLALLRSGSAGVAPAWFLVESDWVVEQARDLADIVVIDSGPMLGTNEAATLVPSVDALVLTTMSGRGTRSQARRTTEQLTRLGALVSGIVVIGAEGKRRYGYYEPIRRAASGGDKTARP